MCVCEVSVSVSGCMDGVWVCVCGCWVCVGECEYEWCV